MPIGFFNVLLHPDDTRGKQLLRTAGTSAGISLFVEIAQCFNYRVPDVDDIILNTIGGLFGALLCILQLKSGLPQQYKQDASQRKPVLQREYRRCENRHHLQSRELPGLRLHRSE